MTDEYKNYLLSSEWLNLKIDIFAKRGRKCERCNRTHKLSIHHLTYDNIFNENPDDLIILCEKCHMKEHNIIKFKKGKPVKQLSLAQKVQLKKQKRLRKLNNNH